MGSPEATSAITVVFDLGGVLAQITHTWEGAAAAAQVPTGLARGEHTALIDFDPFNMFQRGELTLERYLDLLSAFLGCSSIESLRVHNSILVREYPGTPELVRDVRSAGLVTGCLSNTNAPHWKVLVSEDLFPTISSLQNKMASHEVGVEKPNPAIFRMYEEAFSLNADQIVFFDDNAENARVAASLGWNAFRIDADSDPPGQMRQRLGELGVFSGGLIA